MKLYDCSDAPNPRRVRFFLAEKGLDDVELVAADQKGHARIAEDRFTIADIPAFIGVEVLKELGVGIPDQLDNVHRWLAAVSSRPGARA